MTQSPQSPQDMLRDAAAEYDLPPALLQAAMDREPQNGPTSILDKKLYETIAEEYNTLGFIRAENERQLYASRLADVAERLNDYFNTPRADLPPTAPDADRTALNEIFKPPVQNSVAPQLQPQPTIRQAPGGPIRRVIA